MDRRQERKDVAYRKRMWRALAITAAMGVVLLLGFDAWLRQVAAGSDQDPERALRLVGMAATAIDLLIALLAMLLGRYLLGWARQTREQGQWPPAGLQLPGGKPPRHGLDAQRIARQLRWGGITTCVAAAALLAWTVGRLLV